MIRYCRHCRVVPPDRAIVCPECGMPLPPAPSRSTVFAHAAEDDLSADRHALAAPAGVQTSVPALGAYLARASGHERGKARAIFRWLTANVDYDVDALTTPAMRPASPDDVLRRRRAVCQGFSDLLVAIGRAAGLDAVAVSGYARGASYRVGAPYAEHDRHAWNAVWSEGRWMLLDPTWGAGHVDVRSSCYTRCFDPFWFFTPPEQFIHTHWPSDTRWQLMSRPMSQSEQEALPYYRSEWFTHGLSATHLHGHTITCTGSTEITINAPDGVAIMGQLVERDTDGELPWTLSQCNGAHWTVRVILPGAGSHILRLYSKPREAVSYMWCADFRITASHLASRPVPFPRQLAGFEQHRVRLLSPVAGLLRQSDQVHFEVHCPAVAEVAVIQGQEWTHLRRVRATFTGDVRPKLGHLTVAACAATQRTTQRSYDFLLQYDVR